MQRIILVKASHGDRWRGHPLLAAVGEEVPLRRDVGVLWCKPHVRELARTMDAPPHWEGLDAD